MSRDAEKAKASLNRWRQASSGASTGPSYRLATDCQSLPDAEARRRQLSREIEALLLKLNNPSLDADALKSTNDEANRLLRTRRHWERQILALGGIDYKSSKEDVKGTTIPGAGYYQYFGRTRELPEVKRALEAATGGAKREETPAAGEDSASLSSAAKRVRVDPNVLTHDYYGFNDDDLVAEEVLAEQALADRVRAAARPVPEEPDVGAKQDAEKAKRGERVVHWDETWSVPTQQDIEREVLEYKKRALLRKYGA